MPSSRRNGRSWLAGDVELGAHGTYNSTPGYALTSDSANWRTEWLGLIDTVRLQASSMDGTTPIFVGIAEPD